MAGGPVDEQVALDAEIMGEHRAVLALEPKTHEIRDNKNFVKTRLVL